MPKRNWPTHILVLLGYAALTVVITWPLILHIGRALPGEGTDSWQYLWNFWWFDQALSHGQQLYHTPAQYYPGTSLLFHTLSPLHSLVGLPARALGGYLAAYNFVVLLSGLLSGYGTYLLAKEILNHCGKKKGRAGAEGIKASSLVHLAAFLAGATFCLAPYRSVHLLGHLSLIATETLPFFALYCYRALRKPTWKAGLGIALSWLAAALIDWYYPLYMGLLAAFFICWALGETLLKRRTWRELARSGATIAGGLLVAALVLSPLLVPMVREARSAVYLEEPLEFSSTYGADLLAFFLPSPLHPLWGRFFHRWTDGFAAGNTAEGIVYLGFVTLALAGVGLWRQRRAGKLWAAVAGMFGLLSLGPYLKVLHNNTGLPLPYLLFARLPIVRFTRVPSRYVVLVQLALAVLAGLGLYSLLRVSSQYVGGIRDPLDRRGCPPGQVPRSKDRDLPLRRQGSQRGQERRIWLGPALLLALILFEYAAMPYPLTPAEIPPFYQQLADDPKHYALLELPVQQPNSPWYYIDWMLHQTVHGKWSFRGYTSRGDPLFAFGGAPVLRQFERLGPATDILYDNVRPLAGPVLSYYRVGYIVLERQRLEERGQFADAQALVQDLLGPIEPAYADETLVAYPIDWGPVQPFLRLGQGWHEVEGQPWGPFRWMERDQAEIYVILPEAGEVQITFMANSFLKPRQLRVLHGDDMVARLEIGTIPEAYSFSLSLPAGESRLLLLAEGYDVPARLGVGEDTREISVGTSRLRLGTE